MKNMPYYTLGDLLRDCWRARFVLLISITAVLVFAIAWCSLAAPRYGVHMTVGPSDKAGERAIRGLGEMSDFAAVEYLVKKSGLLRKQDDYARYNAILKGEQVAARLHKQMPEKARQLVHYTRWPWQNEEAEVTPAHISAALDSLITSRPTGRGDMREVSIHHPDPAFAKDMLAAVHQEADNILRRRAAKKVDRRIDHLTTRLAATQHPDHRNVLTSLLMRQEQTKMMLSMDQAFAANLISPPAATPDPVWPLPGIIVPAAFVIGLMLGYLGYMVYKVTAARQPANTQAPPTGLGQRAPVTEIRAYSVNE